MVMTGKQEGTMLASPQLDVPLQARPEAHRTLLSSHLLGGRVMSPRASMPPLRWVLQGREGYIPSTPDPTFSSGGLAWAGVSLSWLDL